MYGGTKEEMQRLISDTSKMTDIQEELGITVDESSMSFANCVNAISVMQKKLDITGTTAKEAEKTIQGSVNSMKAAWENLLVAIGQGNVNEALNRFTKSVKTVFNNVTPVVKTALSSVPRVIDGVLNVVTKNIDTVFNNIVDTTLKTITTLGKKLPQILSSVFSTVPKLLNTILKNIGIDVDFTPLFKNLEKISESIVKILGTSLKAIEPIIKSVVQTISSIANVLSSIVANKGLLSFLEVVAITIPTITKGVIPLTQALLSLRGVFSTMSSAVTTFLAEGLIPLKLEFATWIASVEASMIANPFAWAVGAVIALTALITTIALVTKANREEEESHIDLKNAVENEANAIKKLRELKDELTDVEKRYAENVDAVNKATQDLASIQEEYGENGEEIYNLVESGAVAYENLSNAQQEVYKAYLDLINAQDDVVSTEQELVEAKQNVVAATEEERFASIQNDLQLQISAGNYDEFKNHIIDAYMSGQITAQEASTMIVQATEDMDTNARRVFMQSIPEAIQNSNDKFDDAEAKGSELDNALENDFNNIERSATASMGAAATGIGATLNPARYRSQGDSLLSYFSGLWNSIKNIFSQQIPTPTIGGGGSGAGGGGVRSSANSFSASSVVSSMNGFSFSTSSIQPVSNNGMLRANSSNGVSGTTVSGSQRSFSGVNLPQGLITINIEGAKYNSEESLAKAVSYQLEKALRKGRAIWA